MSEILKTAAEIAGETGKNLWKEIGEDALKKAVSTFVGEGVKAMVDLWKTRRVKELEREFKARAKEDEAAASPAVESPKASEPTPEPSPPADPEPTPELDPEPTPEPAPPADPDLPQDERR